MGIEKIVNCEHKRVYILAEYPIELTSKGSDTNIVYYGVCAKCDEHIISDFDNYVLTNRTFNSRWFIYRKVKDA